MPGVDELAFSLAAVSARLKEIGDGGLVRELQQQIGKAVEPVPGQIRAGLRPHLPDRYAEVLDADLRIGRTTSTRDEETRVTVYATGRGAVKRRRLKRLDDGILAHPVYGNRKVWREQGEPSVQPGWFSGPAEDSVPQVREAVDRALEDVAAKAAGKGA